VPMVGRASAGLDFKDSRALKSANVLSARAREHGRETGMGA